MSTATETGTEGTAMGSTTITTAEITRGNACEVLEALERELKGLETELNAATSVSAAATVYERAAVNLDRQAEAWDRRPGRTRDKARWVAECRHQARLTAAAAAIEHVRGRASELGRDLPEPLQLLDLGPEGETLAALVALYEAAAAAASVRSSVPVIEAAADKVYTGVPGRGKNGNS